MHPNFVANMARQQTDRAIISGCVATDHRCTCSRRRGARRDLLTAFGYRIVRRILAMSWYEALPLLGSAAAMSIMILVRPSADARLMFTLLIGTLVLLSVGLAIKDVTTGIGAAYWLAH
jgi:hypothetical protein